MKRHPLTCKSVKSGLLALGFQSKKTHHGSHEKFEHPNFKGQRRVVTVDCPKAPFSPILIKYMASQAGLSVDEFYATCEKA